MSTGIAISRGLVPGAATERSDRKVARWGPILLLTALAGCAFASVIWATHLSAGLTPDSVVYLHAAENLGDSLASGESDVRLVHFPPLFPIVLSISRLWDGDPWIFSRWLNASLMALNTLVLGYILLNRSGGRCWVQFWGIALFVACCEIISMHSFVWSEPLYTLWMLLAIVALEQYLANPVRIHMLMAAGSLTAMACLTRYAGMSLVLSGTLAIVMLVQSGWTRRWRDASVFAAISAAPICLWILYNHLTTGSGTGRSFSIRLIRPIQAQVLLETLGHWWVPLRTAQAMELTVIFAMAAAAVLFVLYGRRLLLDASGPPADHMLLLKILALFSVTYVGFLLVSKTFVDHQTPLDWRILSPLFVTGLLFNVLGLKWLWDRAGRMHLLRVSLAVACALVLSAHVMSSVAWARAVRQAGLGRAKARYTDPVLHQALALLPADVKLYSNATGAISIFTQRTVEPLPEHIADAGRWERALRTLRRELESGRVRIVIFRKVPSPNDLTKTELEQLLPVRIKTRGNGWTLYAYARPRRRASTGE